MPGSALDGWRPLSVSEIVVVPERECARRLFAANGFPQRQIVSQPDWLTPWGASDRRSVVIR